LYTAVPGKGLLQICRLPGFGSGALEAAAKQFSHAHQLWRMGYRFSRASGTDFIMDDRIWTFCHLVVETGHWFSRKEMVISPNQIDRISYEESKVWGARRAGRYTFVAVETWRFSDVRIRGLLRRMTKLKSPMNTIIKLIRCGYELLVASGNLLQSPLLLVLRVYFFWQLFMTGQGHLANIGKVSEFFVSLGIPFPTLNAYLSSSVECFGSLLLIVGLASRLTAIPVAITMAVAYLTADLEAVTSIFSDPDKFVKADPFPYFICALIALVFGPGRISVDALIKRKIGQRRQIGTESS
jgi:putative oxidoreductase